MPRALVAIAWAAATAITVATTFSATAPDPTEEFVRSGEPLVELGSPALVRADRKGGLLLGDPSEGRILRVGPDGTLDEDGEIRIAVDSGRGGLLGLAVDQEGRVFASWVETQGSIAVGRVSGSRPRVAWRGPVVETGSVGGPIAILPDGRLLMAVGALGQPDLIEEEGVVNGKLLSLDPGGGSDQRPTILASGFTNPTALAADRSGVVWVADAVPGEDPQPLVGVSPKGELATVAHLPHGTVTRDLALLGDSLHACGSTGLLLRYRLEDLDGRATADPVASDCAMGVTPFGDQRLAYASGDAIRTIRP